jgi:hypothetical protein
MDKKNFGSMLAVFGLALFVLGFTPFNPLAAAPVFNCASCVDPDGDNPNIASTVTGCGTALPDQCEGNTLDEFVCVDSKHATYKTYTQAGYSCRNGVLSNQPICEYLGLHSAYVNGNLCTQSYVASAGAYCYSCLGDSPVTTTLISPTTTLPGNGGNTNQFFLSTLSMIGIFSFISGVFVARYSN